MKNKLSVVVAAVVSLLAVRGLLAHPGHSGGFSTGILHPFSGVDHLLAMIAVGLWAAQLGKRATWLVPAAFVTMMIAGAAAAFAGLQLPFVEQGITASLLLLGLLIVFAFRMPVWAGMMLVGFFAIFHGFAHGAEMTASASMVEYSMGFVAATVVLHLIGVAIGLTLVRMKQPVIVRVAGAMLAIVGVFAFIGVL